MLTAIAVDVLLIVHFAFIAFVVGGGLLVLRWPALLWWHVAAVAWAAAIEFAGWVCPLTPLENSLRHAAGRAGYSGGFVAHYLLAAMYPAGLTRGVQIALGAGVLAINAAIYGMLRKHLRERAAPR